MHPDSEDALRRRDEILQVMFWMRGEGLGAEVEPGDLRLLLDRAAPEQLRRDLEALAGVGLVEATGAGRFRLTAAGAAEGGRRFHSEFADYMRPGHGACSDPSCDCHTLGPEACAHAAH